MKAVADSHEMKSMRMLRGLCLLVFGELQANGRAIFAAEGRPYPPERLIQHADVAGLVLSILQLPRTSEVTDIVMRPMQKDVALRLICLE